MMAVLVPPSIGEFTEEQTPPALLEWLRQQHATGTVLGGVCIGSIMLARSGLLDGRSATTHWSSAQSFAARYPAVRLEADKPIVDDGDLITTAGLMAWSELGLRLVDRLMGPSIAADTARFLVIEHSDSASQCGSNFAPILGHGDGAILKVQHWLQASGAVDVSVAAMAQEAGLEERTFLRRFRSATGLKPTEYCQHLRVGKARQMLEFTNGTIDHIAWTVGYQDPSAFRATFKKITGLARDCGRPINTSSSRRLLHPQRLRLRFHPEVHHQRNQQGQNKVDRPIGNQPRQQAAPRRLMLQ